MANHHAHYRRNAVWLRRDCALLLCPCNTLNPKQQEGLGLAEQLFAATAATKTAMEGDLKGLTPVFNFTVNPRKLEHGFRRICARIPYTLP